MSTGQRILLDTHIWLWYLLGDERLPRRIRLLLEDEKTELYLSPISVWEAHLLIEKGRLPVTESPVDWISRAQRQLPVRDARLTAAIAMRSRVIALTHDDPADRFIAATAIEMRLPLATVDARLVACSELRCY